MIFDLLFILVALGAFYTGYKNGLIKTLLRGVLFIVGGIAGMYFVIERNQSGWLILAIIIGAYAGAFLGSFLAKSLRLTILRGPLRWIDSLLGSLLEVGKYVLLFYLLGTVLLWAPWPTGQNQVAASKVYLEIDKHAPGILTQLRREVESALEVNLRP